MTTRFPRDAARRYSDEDDSGEWWSRLAIVGADFRSPAEVLACSNVIADRGPVDILINNAAQTIRRPDGAYAVLEDGEQRISAPQLDAAIARHGRFSHEAISSPSPGSALPNADLQVDSGGALEVMGNLPQLGAIDPSGLLIDTLSKNSWSKKLGEIDVMEMLEVQLCNVVAPFLLVSSLIAHSSERRSRYVVNVSATEGQFSRRYKSASHPHTNMAKAALNMLTRTSAGELAKHGVYMTSVDTGWVTDERPFPLQQAMKKAGFQPPLDVVDGAARIYHPIVAGESGKPLWGVLLKHYRKVRW